MLQKGFHFVRIFKSNGKFSYVLCGHNNYFKFNKKLKLSKQFATLTSFGKINCDDNHKNLKEKIIIIDKDVFNKFDVLRRHFSGDKSNSVIEAKPSKTNVKVESSGSSSLNTSTSITSSPSSSILKTQENVKLNKLLSSSSLVSSSSNSLTKNTTSPLKQNKIDLKTKQGNVTITVEIQDSKIQNLIFEKGKENQNNKTETKQTEINSSEKSQQKQKRVRFDSNLSSLERNFVTPARAMSDFLLKASDLENLSKIKRRSPYEQEPPITVFWRKDVEAKAMEIWGSRENLLREFLKREIEKKKHQQNIFTVKRRLRDFRREVGSRTKIIDDEPGLYGKSGRVVLIAIGINTANFIFKSIAWVYTGSHSMFAEAIHSLADTVNQLILAYGIHKSTQIADFDHPYGYTNMKYVSSLVSGVGIFCIGTGLSFYHGILGLCSPEPLKDLFWAYLILGGSLVSEGATLVVAVNEIKRSAKKNNMSFKDYVLRGHDPCVNVVLTEDAAAVASVGVASCCMGISSYTGSPIPDAVGSLLVGSILGCVASFIIYSNGAALVGRSIPEEHLNRINAELESDIMIRAIHDVKGIDMGNSLVRYKAEMDFDGRELTRFYLDKLDLNELLKEVKSFQTIDELEVFLLKHGENIVDLMGGEIDRIEMKLRKKFPEIRHCDLEIL